MVLREKQPILRKLKKSDDRPPFVVRVYEGGRLIEERECRSKKKDAEPLGDQLIARHRDGRVVIRRVKSFCHAQPIQWERITGMRGSKWTATAWYDETASGTELGKKVPRSVSRAAALFHQESA